MAQMGAGVSFIPSGKLCPREAVNLHLKTHRICFLRRYQHVSCLCQENLREQTGSSKGLSQQIEGAGGGWGYRGLNQQKLLDSLPVPR